MLCVLNRTGRARLLACAACGDLARCERCEAAVVQPDAGPALPRAAGPSGPAVCLHCGAGRFKHLRAGVSRVREELEALVGEPVAEVTARSDPAEAAGAGSSWAPRPCCTGSTGPTRVAFLDLDQELLAPRYRAAEQALALLARAARVVAASGRPLGTGRPATSCSRPACPTTRWCGPRCTPTSSPSPTAERARRSTLGLPPFRPLAIVSGRPPPPFVAGLGRTAASRSSGSDDGSGWLRAPDHAVLCDALAATPRPPGRLRIEVDPLRA